MGGVSTMWDVSHNILPHFFLPFIHNIIFRIVLPVWVIPFCPQPYLTQSMLLPS